MGGNLEHKEAYTSHWPWVSARTSFADVLICILHNRTWQAKPREVGAAVEVAVRTGYRHIDCAHIYGNEAEVGETLHKCFKEGVVKREEMFITSKLWYVGCDDFTS